MERIGIFGGTFDPPHFGHTLVVQMILDMNIVDKIVIATTEANPFKYEKPMFTHEQRIEMCKRAYQHIRNISICDIKYSYTIDMLEYITTVMYAKNTEPRSYYLIVGSDIDSAILRWKNIEQYPKYISDFIVMRREGLNEDKNISTILNKSPISIGGISVDNIPLNSTRLRNAINYKDFKYLRQYTPASVCDYIKTLTEGKK